MNESLKKALLKVADATNIDSAALVEAHEKSFKAEKEFREKAANEIMSWTNTWFGAEARTTVMFKDELYSMINRQSRLLSFLPGNHGQIESTDTVQVPIFGEVEYFNRWSELSGNPLFINRQANDALKTDKATIKFWKFTKLISVTIEELTRYAGWADAMYKRIEDRIVQAFANSIESFIINGDSDAVSALNINGTALANVPASVNFGTDGLRKVGIANGLVGAGQAYSRAILGLMYDAIDYYNDDPEKLLWINSNKFASKVRFDPTYSTVEKFGPDATNTQGWPLPKIEGITAYQSKDMPRFVASTGKVAASGNDHVTSLLIYRPAVQYAYGISLNIVTHNTSDAILFDCTWFFGFDIVNAKAGLGKTIALWVTLA